MTDQDDSRTSVAGEPARAFPSIEKRYRDLVEWLPAVVYEAEAGPDGAFHYVSPQIEELLGYSPSEWIANPRLWLERLHPDDRQETLRREHEHQRYARDKDVRMRTEYRMVHRDGHVVSVRDEARLTQSGAEPAVWRGVLVEMTAAGASPYPPDAAGGDAMRLNCAACGASWVAERHESCRECGSRDVEAISLNATLRALGAARHDIERLIGGIHEHLDELGIWMHPDASPSSPDADEQRGG